MRRRALVILCWAGCWAAIAGCRRSEHLGAGDAWWLSLLDQPQRRGTKHYCVTDGSAKYPVHPGEPSYCLTHYPGGQAVYRRDGDGTLVQGWRLWDLSFDDSSRWQAMRDSIFGAVTQLVGDTPKCRDAMRQGRTRVTSWPYRSYELSVVTLEPEPGGPQVYQVTVALRRPMDACRH